ncbi:hypothetical protein FACS189429_0980 [Bacteroidia bacterium]|nr:hypothetical protein FACS189429_0980 [Bacteroidia bacterium]
MKTKTLFLLVSCLLLLSNLQVFGQGRNALAERRTSALTYIYRIADSEAKTLLLKTLEKIEQNLFYDFVDSFPADSTYRKPLAAGHYLFVKTVENRQTADYRFVPAFDVLTLNNNTDLCIQVIDLQGNIVTDAEVRVKSKLLKLDKKTNCYTDKKSYKKGILSVNYKGVTAFYRLEREMNNTSLRRGMNFVLYRTPLNLVSIPVYYAAHPQSTKWRLESAFRWTKEGFQRLFDKDFDGNEDWRFEQKHSGYFVFNKPKYLPHDTVKFKAFIVKKSSGKPVKEPIKAVLYDYNSKAHTLAVLNPYNAGGYEFSFVLHDSLNLKLDRQYRIELVENKEDYEERRFINGYFQYEDYELSKLKLTVRVPEKQQFAGVPFSVFAKAADENDLQVMDARLKIFAKPQNINRLHENLTYVRDTLFYFEKPLLPTGETEIALPDSLFPKANLSYRITFALLTSDNQTLTKTENVNYFYRDKKIELSLENDSVSVIYRENNIRKQKNVKIFAADNFQNETFVYQGITPFSLPLNPFYKTYTAAADSAKTTLDISAQNPMLGCYSQRTGDSVFFNVQNPRNLTFTYNIYKKNTEKTRGAGTSLNYRTKERSAQNYFVSMRYLWGGAVKDETYRIPFYDRRLNVDVVQPALAFPGQKVETEIRITDKNGKPVQNVDITAFALTSKFNYAPPVLPDFSKKYPNKNIVNNFKIKDLDNKKHSEILNRQYWENLAQLDTIEFYKFLYPAKDSIYRYEMPAPDFISQFAPFVFDENGNLQPVHVIYLDSRPVYFGWATNEQPYSFRADAGNHHIRLRLADREIVLSKINIPPAKKLIFSMRNDIRQYGIANYEKKKELSEQEQNTLYRYIFPYRNNFGNKFAFIRNGDNIQLLSQPNNKSYYPANFALAGPISGNVHFTIRDGYSVKNKYNDVSYEYAADMQNLLLDNRYEFNLQNGYSLTFNHEAFFEYEFAPNILKMRELKRNLFPKKLWNFPKINSNNLNDKALTINEIDTRWNYYQKQLYLQMRQKPLFYYPAKTEKGFGTLNMNIENKFKEKTGNILNLLLFRLDETKFLRVYTADKNVIYQLDEGFYKVMLLFDNEKYHICDSVFVGKNGNNYLKISVPQELQRDDFSINIDKEIVKTLQNANSNYTTNYSEKSFVDKVYQNYNQKYVFDGEGYEISGVVYEKGTNEPIIGATVLVKGTTYSTQTDIDGRYALKVPYDRHILLVSFIGYTQKELDLQTSHTTNVVLEADAVMLLEELVIVGYGTVRKSDFTGSVSTISGYADISRSLQGKVAGVSVQNVSGTFGAAPQIRVRGASSVDGNSEPLYVIDGQIYTGAELNLDEADIASFEILKDASATAIYGARAINGVIVITTKKGNLAGITGKSAKAAKPEFDAAFLESAMSASTIRSRFSDYAYWQPRLTSDKNGLARFSATLPDDVTNWDTYVLAMNGKRQSGQTQGNIRSFKPIMAQLAVPRFLTAGDTANVIGKSLNYTADSISARTSFEIDGKILAEKNLKIADSQIDTLRIVAPADSFKLRYTMHKSDGYFDGEEREIPVFPVGLEETKGDFLILDGDTAFAKTFDNALGTVHLYVNGSALAEMNLELERVINYRYLCNEQLASKLKAFLLKKQIAEYQGIVFEENEQIEKLITELLNRRNSAGWWGWWQNSELYLPFSIHVLTALAQARQQGFKAEVDLIKLGEMAVILLDKEKNLSAKIQWLQMLKNIDAPINFRQYIDSIPQNKLIFNDFLRLTYLRQQLEMKVNTDTLQHFRQTTLFGSYFDNKKEDENLRRYSLTDSKIQNTLLVYKILKKENKDNPILAKIRLYFFENKAVSGWRNTYETMNIAETILPDIWGADKKLTHSVLRISGVVEQTLYTQPDTEKKQKGFPFSAEFAASQSVSINKTGDEPLFFTLYQRLWNASPQEKQNDFVIKTAFEGGKTTLKAGEKIKLTATLEVKKDADYVMINIPIPAGCSYGAKPQKWYPEIHREYFKNETAIFCNKLRKGTYTFEIELLPRFTGTYHLNPAKAELMYFPTFNANEAMKMVKVGE